MSRGLKGVSIIALCNTVLQRCFDNDIPISHTRLQAIIYKIHQQYHLITDKWLFTGDFDCNGNSSTIAYKFINSESKRIDRFLRDANGNVFVVKPDGILDDLIWEEINRY